MDRSLIYVSRRPLATFDPERAVEEIVATARSRNAALNITGALACTRSHFTQLLEGSPATIDELMHSIENDPRHTDVTILEVSSIIQRTLPDWTMAYSGDSTYVARQLEALLLDQTSMRVDRLRSLIIGFAGADLARGGSNLAGAAGPMQGCRSTPRLVLDVTAAAGRFGSFIRVRRADNTKNQHFR
jgi:hypothetical protein